jgi:uncharacterized protein YcbK (DUF882 family)
MLENLFFTRKEMACHGTGECEMDDNFMEKLVSVRKKFNTPMIINSGYRHVAHNSAINGAPKSPHIYGRAVDVAVSGKDAYRLIRIAMEMGMTGIGVAQRGAIERRFIHLDDMGGEDHPRPWVWSYK